MHRKQQLNPVLTMNGRSSSEDILHNEYSLKKENTICLQRNDQSDHFIVDDVTKNNNKVKRNDSLTSVMFKSTSDNCLLSSRHKAKCHSTTTVVDDKNDKEVLDNKALTSTHFKEMFAFFNKSNNCSKKRCMNQGEKPDHTNKSKKKTNMKQGETPDHYCLININNIPKWKEDEVYIREPKSSCPLGRTMHCENCMNIMFSQLHRGKPVASIDWFTNTHDDYLSSSRYKYTRLKISKKLFSMLTKHEISLRKISRNDVYHALIKRFRGFYDSKDTIDYILYIHKVSSVRQWCLWKDELDNKFSIEHNSILNKNLYCSGCGEKCYKFQSRNSTTFYQKCSNNICGFFYKEDSSFARIKET